MQISGEVALVTGGGSGLGTATARFLAEKGGRVAVLDSDAQRAGEVAEKIGGLACSVNVSDDAGIGAAMARTREHFGQAPRIAISCAGIGSAARIVGRDGSLSVDTFLKVIEVNLVGSYVVMSHAARAMQALEPTSTGERGVIVNTASIAWQDGQLGQAAYAASKGGVAAMTLPAARELARSGIRVVTIAPGLFHTPMMEGLPQETTEAITQNIPFPARLGDPKEFALMAAQIIENPYLNGTTIRLDGAVRMPQR